jgi:aspartate kinase
MPEQKILVQKFGGTSVSTAERRQKVVGHVRRAQEQGYQVAIVVSAMGRRGEPYATDTLLDLLRSDGRNVEARTHDMIFVCGEIISAAVITHLLNGEGIPAEGLTGAQAGFYTNDNFSEADILEVDQSRTQSLLEKGVVPVVAGCQGKIRDTGDFTTLGRGGSDTSGVALGAALKAEEVEIFTDVQGVARVDPRLVPQADWLEHIHYDSMLEMARFGAGVMHPRAVKAGKDAGVPVEVRSTFSTYPGTMIDSRPDEYPLVGISTLGPLRAVFMERDTLGTAARDKLEKDRLVMSLVDSNSGKLILGASPGKAVELAALKQELDFDIRQAPHDQSWVSLVGEVNGEIASVGRALLEAKGITVRYHETTNHRITYIIRAEDQTQSVKILYNHYFDI